MKNPIWIFVIDTELGIENGCPRRDPRQNSAGINALRKGENFDEKIAGDPPSKTRVVWEPLRSLGSSSQGSVLGRTIERG